ncbi:MAG: hypothetical protein ACMVY4_02375 [Minwuia sp.]|uniref:hypothetical protein n=1 Tax=Minwuia sp. TaxID=2493630 RepID=UPI003A85DC1C
MTQYVHLEINESPNFPPVSVRVLHLQKGGRDPENEIFEKTDHRRVERGEDIRKGRRSGRLARGTKRQDLFSEVEADVLYVSDARRMRVIESAKAKLKGLLADVDFDHVKLKGPLERKFESPLPGRKAVTHLRACQGLSEPPVSGVVSANRKRVSSHFTWDDVIKLDQRLCEPAHVCWHTGYRCLYARLRREGVMINHKSRNSIVRMAWRQGDNTTARELSAPGRMLGCDYNRTCSGGSNP